MIFMNTFQALTKAIPAILLSCFCLSAYAQPTMLYTHDKVRFMSGGIGTEEVLEMRKNARRYTLNLLFSEGNSGSFVSGHNVDIYNEHGERVFKLKNAKPLLYVNLPAGTYSILAVNNGAKLRHKFTLEENKSQKIILNWKDEDGEESESVGENN